MSTVAATTAAATAVNSVSNALTTGSNAASGLTGALAGTTGSTTTANSLSGTAATSGTTANSSTLLGSNMNTFLTLLTTQLQNQDPLSPLDTNDFTQQLVEFSQVEQQINTNNNLTSLISLQGQSDMIAAQSLVGQTVEVNAASAPLVNGQASWDYTLPSTAASTSLAVTNASGAVVWAGTGNTTAGTQSFTWNGEDMNGDDQPAGTYTLNVSATAADGSAITPTITTLGTVQSVASQSGAPAVTIGGTTYPLSELAGVQPSSN